jgi:hypothetical protein
LIALIYHIHPGEIVLGALHLQIMLVLVVLLVGCPQGKPSIPDSGTNGDPWPVSITPDVTIASDGAVASDVVPVTVDSVLPPELATFNCNGTDLSPGCVCRPGTTQACYTGPAGTRSKGQCKDGTQTCDASGLKWNQGCTGEVLPAKETCDDKIDNNCNGQVDEGCPVKVNVPVSGDCVTIKCPPQAPHPVGCTITMGGGDCRGCVAHAPGSSEVYFQEGDECEGSPVKGQVHCSSVKAGGLDVGNCFINKKHKYYVDDPWYCPWEGGNGC